MTAAGDIEKAVGVLRAGGLVAFPPKPSTGSAPTPRIPPPSHAYSRRRDVRRPTR